LTNIQLKNMGTYVVLFQNVGQLAKKIDFRVPEDPPCRPQFRENYEKVDQYEGFSFEIVLQKEPHLINEASFEFDLKYQDGNGNDRYQKITCDHGNLRIGNPQGVLN